MRLLFLLLFLPVVSCKPSLTTQQKVTATSGPLDAVSPVHQISNRDVWQRIIEKPGSASLDFQVNDTTVALLTLSGRLDSLYYKPDSLTVKIYKGTGQTFVLNSDTRLWQQGETHPYVDLQDLNFDGFLDLLLFDHAGSVNYWYNVFLYQPGTGYSVNDDFGQLPSLRVDPNKKRVMSLYHVDDCEQYAGYYTVNANQLKPVMYVYNTTERDTCFTYQKELVKDKWKVKNLGAWSVSLYDSLYQF